MTFVLFSFIYTKSIFASPEGRHTPQCPWVLATTQTSQTRLLASQPRPPYSCLTPAITISVLQDILTVTITINLSTCNTGQCKGGEAILSL